MLSFTPKVRSCDIVWPVAATSFIAKLSVNSMVMHCGSTALSLSAKPMSKTGYPPHRRIPALPVLRGIHGHCHRRRRPALGRVAPPLRPASGSGRVQSPAWSETQSLPERQPDFFVLGLAPKSQADRGDTPAED